MKKFQILLGCLTLCVLGGIQSVAQVGQPPTVLRQPQSQYGLIGSNAVFEVDADGTEPFKYQWSANGTALAGKTNRVLHITSLLSRNTASYRVTIRNSFGSVTSHVARLEVRPTLPAPAEPSIPVALVGWNADVVAENDGNPAVTTSFDQCCNNVWFESGLDNHTDGLPPDRQVVSLFDPSVRFRLQPYQGLNILRLANGAASGTLRLVAPARFRTLSVLAVSGAGSGQGRVVLNFTDGRHSTALNFNAPDWYDNVPDANRLPAIAGLERVTGTVAPFIPQSGGITDIGFSIHETDFDLGSLGLDTGLLESLTFTKNASPAVTGIFAVSGRPKPTASPGITQEPTNIVEMPGGTAIFSVAASGTAPLSYQWRRNGKVLPGITNTTYAIPNVSPTDNGVYTVVIANDTGVVISRKVRLRVPTESLPFTDSFAARGLLSAPSGQGSFSNVNATRELGEPVPLRRDARRTVWASYTTPGDGVVTLSTLGSDFDTILAVYTGESLDGLARVVEDDDSEDFFNSRVTFRAEAGRKYSIVVGGRSVATGLAVLTWSFSNQEVAPARILGQPLSLVANLGSEAVFEVTATNATRFQWLHHGVPLVDSAHISGATTARLTLHAITDADLGTYRVRVNEDTPTLSERVSLSIDTGVPGPTATAGIRSYDKFADARDPARGGAIPLLTPSAPATHGPRLLGLSAGASGTSIFRTSGENATEDGEPIHCGIPGGASEWTALTVEAPGTLVLDTFGSDFDTVLAVYEDSGLGTELFDGLISLACNNDVAPPIDRTSQVSFPAYPSHVYMVAVDGVNGVTGKVVLNRQLQIPLLLQVLDGAPAGRFRVQASGAPGQRIALQFSTDLASWTDLVQTNLTATPLVLETANAGNDDRFFRATIR